MNKRRHTDGLHAVVRGCYFALGVLVATVECCSTSGGFSVAAGVQLLDSHDAGKLVPFGRSDVNRRAPLMLCAFHASACLDAGFCKRSGCIAAGAWNCTSVLPWDMPVFLLSARHCVCNRRMEAGCTACCEAFQMFQMDEMRVARVSI